MRLTWVGNKEETAACFILFTLVGLILGFLMSASLESSILSAAVGALGGFLLWALIAVQDLRFSRKTQKSNHHSAFGALFGR